jgi:hypothetical protein
MSNSLNIEVWKILRIEIVALITFSTSLIGLIKILFSDNFDMINFRIWIGFKKLFAVVNASIINWFPNGPKIESKKSFLFRIFWKTNGL